MSWSVEGEITLSGLKIPIAALVARLGGRAKYNRFLSALTVTEKPQPGRPKTYARVERRAYASPPKDPAHLLLPLVKRHKLWGPILSRISHAKGVVQARRLGGDIRIIPSQKWVPAQEFYTYQTAAANYLCRIGGPLPAKGGGTGFAYVQMGTGMGKSRFGMAVAARGLGPVFIVVATEGIRMQWIDEFKKVYPDLSIAPYVNLPKNSKKIPPSAATHDVVVGIVNTVRAKDAGFFKGYATVILDEAHELCSPKNMRVLWLVQRVPRVLGLSATPDVRPDGLDRIVYHFLGKPIWAKKDIPGFDITDVNFRGRVREVEYAGNPEYCETALSSAGTVSAIGTIDNIVKDPDRLSLVAAEVERLYRLHETPDKKTLEEFGLGPRPKECSNKGHPAGEIRKHGILVFAELRDYLPVLRDALLTRFSASEISVPELEETVSDKRRGVKVLRGGAARSDVKTAHNSRIVLTTYGYSRRGISIVEMTALVLATPRRNGMVQILGRATRRGSDESIVRVIVDIKDVRTGLKSQSTTRRAVYKEEKKYPIYQVKVDYKGIRADSSVTVGQKEELVWAPARGKTGAGTTKKDPMELMYGARPKGE
jgi:hypothetical protein